MRLIQNESNSNIKPQKQTTPQFVYFSLQPSASPSHRLPSFQHTSRLQWRTSTPGRKGAVETLSQCSTAQQEGRVSAQTEGSEKRLEDTDERQQTVSFEKRDSGPTARHQGLDG